MSDEHEAPDQESLRRRVEVLEGRVERLANYVFALANRIDQRKRVDDNLRDLIGKHEARLSEADPDIFTGEKEVF